MKFSSGRLPPKADTSKHNFVKAYVKKVDNAKLWGKGNDRDAPIPKMDVPDDYHKYLSY